MAGCEELANVPPMDAGESSKKRRVREFVASWFLERCLAMDEQETSIDFGKRLSKEFMMPPTEKGVEALDGERKRFSGPAAAHGTAIAKIQMDKAKRQAVMASGGDERRFSVVPKGAPVDTGKDKTVVEVLYGDEFITITSGAPTVETGVDNVQTEEMDECAESDHLRLAPAIPIVTDDLSSITHAAKLLNKSDEWIQKRMKLVEESAACSKRINDMFVKILCDELNKEGEDEDEDEDEDEEDDDEYNALIDARYAKLQELHTRLWNEVFEGDCREEDKMMALA